eukprot:NODE_269_length_1098_cov_20.389895_g217_i0.p2 GENE.NODE_269_length_1098_cov_20.389895_g217_i0~~NODE_269_length_1098_cov_20.389895_g217_i0.p2  ORF type:complete len:59 (-),score=6.52 NODE_269_length_1098_cov_20.389895_g217_i0:348-524(-)
MAAALAQQARHTTAWPCKMSAKGTHFARQRGHIVQSLPISTIWVPIMTHFCRFLVLFG